MQGAEYPKDATIKARQFVIRDFVIGTYPAVYAHVTTDGTNIDVSHDRLLYIRLYSRNSIDVRLISSNINHYYSMEISMKFC